MRRATVANLTTLRGTSLRFFVLGVVTGVDGTEEEFDKLKEISVMVVGGYDEQYLPKVLESNPLED
jgi:hypothetical protein